MDTFQRAEQNIIAALFLNYHRPSHSRLVGRKELWEEFGIEVDDKMRFAVLAELKKNHWIYSTSDGRAHLLEAGYKPARQAVLDRVRGSSIEVDWVAGEVTTDGEYQDDFPMPKTWVWHRWGPSCEPTPAESRNLLDSDMTRTHVVPLPDGMVKKPRQINWNMWGVVVAVMGVIVAIVAIVLAE